MFAFRSDETCVLIPVFVCYDGEIVRVPDFSVDNRVKQRDVFRFPCVFRNTGVLPIIAVYFFIEKHEFDFVILLVIRTTNTELTLEYAVCASVRIDLSVFPHQSSSVSKYEATHLSKLISEPSQCH